MHLAIFKKLDSMLRGCPDAMITALILAIAAVLVIGALYLSPSAKVALAVWAVA